MAVQTRQLRPSGSATPILDVSGLTKRFPIGGLFGSLQVHALENVSFRLERGQTVALVGESGSGKSTTARLVAGLIPPTAGVIRLHGRDVIAAEPRQASLAYRGQVQMIFQDPFGSLNPVHTVSHHLERPLQIHKKARGRRRSSRPSIPISSPVASVSGSPSPALAVDPIVLLADEPISMLDVSIRMGVLNLMDRLKDERGIATLYITHDIASARYIGDETIAMYAGRMVEGGPSVELIDHPAHPYTQLLLSAVPNPHAGLAKQRVEARGEVPSLIDPPPGCPFTARCPHAMDVCRQVMPGVEVVAPGHWVRCHLHGPGASETVNGPLVF